MKAVTHLPAHSSTPSQLDWSVRRTRVKICGITNADDAFFAVACGADAIGFIFANSPRRVSPSLVVEICNSLPPFVATVGVFMNQPVGDVHKIAKATGITHIQLHGDENEAEFRLPHVPTIKRLAVDAIDTIASIDAQLDAMESVTPLLDPGCGDGKRFDWTIAKNISRPWLLAGGLNTQNVASAIEIARPFGVDVCSGIETEPGQKDHHAIMAFMNQVRKCDVSD